MGTSDDSFRAEGPGLFGFLTESNDDNVPVKAFGTVGYAPNVGVLGFSGVAADPEGPIQHRRAEHFRRAHRRDRHFRHAGTDADRQPADQRRRTRQFEHASRRDRYIKHDRRCVRLFQQRRGARLFQ